jgi:photosynthetic reaction center cytochrome c subunit
MKPTKLVARVMMQMVSEINQKLAANIKKPADQLTAVGCMTCHRGEAIPKVPPPAPAPARGAAPGGAPPATTQPPPGR